MSKLVKFSLILILSFILTTVFFRNTILRFLICNSVAKASGLELAIEDLNLDIVNSSLYMRGINLFNPSGFEDKILGKAQEIFIKYDLLGLFRGRLHLRLVKLDISEINIIRNQEGKSNVASFKRNQPQIESSSKAVSTAVIQKDIKRNRKGRIKLLIDKLELSKIKLTFIDYQAGIGESAVIIFTTDGPLVFKNVNDLSYVADAVSAKAGFRHLFNNLAEIVKQDIIKNTTETMKTTAETMKRKIGNVLIPKAE